MTLVNVGSPAQGDDLTAAECPDDHSAFVSSDLGFGKARNVAERDAHRVSDRLGEPTQAGAEYDPDARLLGRGALADRFGGFDGSFGRVLALHPSDPISSSILSDASSINIIRS